MKITVWTIYFFILYKGARCNWDKRLVLGLGKGKWKVRLLLKHEAESSGARKHMNAPSLMEPRPKGQYYLKSDQSPTSQTWGNVISERIIDYNTRINKNPWAYSDTPKRKEADGVGSGENYRTMLSSKCRRNGQL